MQCMDDRILIILENMLPRFSISGAVDIRAHNWVREYMSGHIYLDGYRVEHMDSEMFEVFFGRRSSRVH